MFGSPLQLARVSHTAGHHRIRIDRPVLDLTQRFLLGEQEDVPAGLNGLAVWSDGSGSMEEGGMLQRDEGEPDSETCTEDNQQNAAHFAIPPMAAGRAAPDDRLNAPCFRLIQQLLPTFLRPVFLGSGPKDTSLRYINAVQVPSPGA
jgi:hypothetical protein